MNASSTAPPLKPIREPWKFLVGYWLVLGVALFLSGLSQGPLTISLVRNLYLLVAGFLACLLHPLDAAALPRPVAVPQPRCGAAAGRRAGLRHHRGRQSDHLRAVRHRRRRPDHRATCSPARSTSSSSCHCGARCFCCSNARTPSRKPWPPTEAGPAAPPAGANRSQPGKTPTPTLTIESDGILRRTRPAKRSITSRRPGTT